MKLQIGGGILAGSSRIASRLMEEAGTIRPSNALGKMNTVQEIHFFYLPISGKSCNGAGSAIGNRDIRLRECLQHVTRACHSQVRSFKAGISCSLQA